LAYYCVASPSPLSLNSSTSHKYHVIINGIGGIAAANIYSMDFDNNEVRTMITHIPFNHHKSFPTKQDAFTYLVLYFPYIKTPTDVTFMNENCPKKSSNLTKPSCHFQEISDLNFIPPSRDIKEFFHYDHLQHAIKTTRDAATLRMICKGCSPIDNYTLTNYFPPSPPTPLAHMKLHSPNHPSIHTTYTVQIKILHHKILPSLWDIILLFPPHNQIHPPPPPPTTRQCIDAFY
jgi:hypothetical protein